jgi:hypothetical protein
MIEDIKAGKFDESLDMILAAVRSRKDALKPQIWEFQVGDPIRMVNTNPKYLNGARGIVKKINRTKIVVDLDIAHGRFHRNITTPLSMVEKVSCG